MYKVIGDVVAGDVILESGGGKTVVKSVETEVCKHKVHINERDCYENFTEVRVMD